MSCLDCALCKADRALNCAAPFIRTQLAIEVWTWAGGRVGNGPRSRTSNLVLPKKYQVREISMREIQRAGGVFAHGDVAFGPVIPAYNCNGTTGGFTKVQLDPKRTFDAPEPALEVIYRLTGDVDGAFALVDLDTSNPTGWKLTLRNTRLSP